MPLEFEIAPDRKIGGNHPCFIIAEIGQNHQGDMKIAKDLIKVAKVSILFPCSFFPEVGAECESPPISFGTVGVPLVGGLLVQSNAVYILYIPITNLHVCCTLFDY